MVSGPERSFVPQGICALQARRSETSQGSERAGGRRVHLVDPAQDGGKGNGRHAEDGQWRWSVSHTCSRRDLRTGRGLEDSVRTRLTVHCGAQIGARGDVDVF